MDSFFVEVERVRDPGLKNRPVAVGGTGRRGVIASASYEAREFGVHSAQPTSVALRVCPNLEVVSPAHGKYGEVSEMVFAVFRSFTPLVEGLSLDEAFLDVRGLRHHYESPVDVAKAIRSCIRDDLRLPASVGIARSKFVAKLASEAAKPDGYKWIREADQVTFVRSLPIQALWGVGPATMASMKRLGVKSVGDLAELPETAVLSEFGPAQGHHLRALANAEDPRVVEPDSSAKSISVEETYSQDLESRDVVEASLLAHAQRLSGRLRRAGLAAGTLSLKVRYKDFTTVSRSTTPGGVIDAPRELFQVALQLLDQTEQLQPVRLLGLSGSSLELKDSPQQLTIDTDENWARIADAVSDLRDRFGEHVVEPARLLDTNSQESEPEE
jgi:DNA polymerase-4